MIPRLNPIDLSGNVEKLGGLALGQVSLPSRQLNFAESKVAIAGVALSPSHSPSKNVFTTSVRLHQPSATAAQSSIPLPNSKSSPRFATLNPPTAQSLKEHASQQLLKPDLKPGNKLLMQNMKDVPEQLEKDLNRSGTLDIGDKSFPSTYYGGKPYANVFRWTSASLKDYIKGENPKLNVDHSKMNEILYSTVQNFGNDIMIQKNDELPNNFEWGVSTDDSKMTTKFEFEKKSWGINAPEVLVVSKKIEKKYTNLSNEALPKKDVIIETQIKHNLKTGEVTFNYKFTMDGNTQEWNPANPPRP
ncbi:MAG: hypothetical protein H0W50_01285 [Parachlamydiaceae bacterium]|nr:hypothetical protein [Parachlamydiaceae bacterium]